MDIARDSVWSVYATSEGSNSDPLWVISETL
jgi:hypothetical protein